MEQTIQAKISTISTRDDGDEATLGSTLTCESSSQVESSWRASNHLKLKIMLPVMILMLMIMLVMTTMMTIMLVMMMMMVGGNLFA